MARSTSNQRLYNSFPRSTIFFWSWNQSLQVLNYWANKLIPAFGSASLLIIPEKEDQSKQGDAFDSLWGSRETENKTKFLFFFRSSSSSSSSSCFPKRFYCPADDWWTYNLVYLFRIFNHFVLRLCFYIHINFSPFKK